MENTVQHYGWGSTTMLQRLRGVDEPAEEREAELWMGAHPRGPSLLVDPEGHTTPIPVNTIPFLLKILTAEKGLSIQAHPDKISAEEGFARENAAGVPVHGRERNYRDTNHKPELICGVTDFWALRGFRPVSAIAMELAGIIEGAPNIPVALARAIEELYEDATVTRWKRVFLDLLRIRDDGKTRSALCAAAERYAAARAGRDRDDPYWWVLELQRQFPDDPGTIAPLYLNLVHLKPGQAMYLDANTLHAYLYGTGVEIMAASDNVLRAGCTEKHVDVDELARILRFDRENVPPVKPHREARVWTYITPAREFELHRLRIRPHERIALSHRSGPVVVLSIAGEVEVHAGGTTLSLTPGTSVFIEPPRGGSENTISVVPGSDGTEGEAIVFVAALPEMVREKSE